jgi:hypothetical protein
VRRSNALVLSAVVLLLFLAAEVLSHLGNGVVAHKTSGVLYGLCLCCLAIGGLWAAVPQEGQRWDRKYPPFGPLQWGMNRLNPTARRGVLVVTSVAMFALGLVGVFRAI